LDARRHWDATCQLGAEALVEIERRVALRAVAAFDLDVSSLALDMTNFASFIDSTNTRASLAQRGKAKQKRCDSKQRPRRQALAPRRRHRIGVSGEDP
jgi:hypothetical protein